MRFVSQSYSLILVSIVISIISVSSLSFIKRIIQNLYSLEQRHISENITLLTVLR